MANVYDFTKPATSILCLNNINGNLSVINELAATTKAVAVICSGNFGFYVQNSHEHLSTIDLHLVLEDQSTFGTGPTDVEISKMSIDQIRGYCSNKSMSELQDYIDGKKQFTVPVYVCYGGGEDFQVLKKFKEGKYQISNLHILFANASNVIQCGDLNLRLFGLGGSVVYEKLFQLGRGDGILSGDKGFNWVNCLQIGELIEHARLHNNINEKEVRLFISYIPTGREPLFNLLCRELKCIYNISHGFHTRICMTLNDYSCHDLESFKNWLGGISQKLEDMIGNVLSIHKVSERDTYLTNLVLDVIKKQQSAIVDENDLKKFVSLNLPDFHDGYAMLKIFEDESIGVETFSKGFKYHMVQTRMPSNEKTASRPITTNNFQASSLTNSSWSSTDSSNNDLSISVKSHLSPSPDIASSNYAGSPLIIISNLPSGLTSETQISSSLLSAYTIKSLAFYNRFNDSVRCDAGDEASAVKILNELDGMNWNGNVLRVSRVGMGAKLQ